MEIINTTPHAVKIMDKEGNVLRSFEPSGISIRLESQVETIGSIDGLPLTRTKFGSTELPEFAKDTYYIVSALVANAFPERSDLLIPNEAVRDDAGRIVGCLSLGRVK